MFFPALVFVPRRSHKVLVSSSARGEHGSLQQTTAGWRDTVSWGLSPPCWGFSGTGQHSKHPCQRAGNLLRPCSYQSLQENQERILSHVSRFGISIEVLSKSIPKEALDSFALLQPRL